MFGDPVARDVEPRRHPDFVMAQRVIEEARERGGAAGATDETAMQADRQHLRRDIALGVERVEGILEIGVELVARIEALRRGEAHVIRVERIGRDQLRPARPLQPIGQIVGIGIGAIEEAAFLHAEADRVDRGAALIEAERARAGDFRMDAHRLGDVLRFPLGGNVAIVDPLVAMRGDFPARLVHGRDRLRMARHGGGDGIDGDRNLALREHAMQAPEAGARAIFVDRFHVHVALARPGRGADDLGQEGLGGGVAVQDVVLAAFLVVDDELQGHARAARPVRERRIAAIADHVARIGLGHATPLARKRPAARTGLLTPSA